MGMSNGLQRPKLWGAHRKAPEEMSHSILLDVKGKVPKVCLEGWHVRESGSGAWAPCVLQCGWVRGVGGAGRSGIARPVVENGIGGRRGCRK